MCYPSPPSLGTKNENLATLHFVEKSALLKSMIRLYAGHTAVFSRNGTMRQKNLTPASGALIFIRQKTTLDVRF